MDPGFRRDDGAIFRWGDGAIYKRDDRVTYKRVTRVCQKLLYPAGEGGLIREKSSRFSAYGPGALPAPHFPGSAFHTQGLSSVYQKCGKYGAFQAILH